MKLIDADKLIAVLDDKLEGLRSEYRLTEGHMESALANNKIAVLEDVLDAIKRVVVE